MVSLELAKPVAKVSAACLAFHVVALAILASANVPLVILDAARLGISPATKPSSKMFISAAVAVTPKSDRESTKAVVPSRRPSSASLTLTEPIPISPVNVGSAIVAFKSKAACCKVDIGFAESAVLFTLPRPTSSASAAVRVAA